MTAAMTDEFVDGLAAVGDALNPGEQAAFLDRARRWWPQLATSDVADILEMVWSVDAFLRGQVDGFYKRYGHLIPKSPAATHAVHALLIQGQAPDDKAVSALLGKAGL
jgi:hypothetical protein